MVYRSGSDEELVQRQLDRDLARQAHVRQQAVSHLLRCVRVWAVCGEQLVEAGGVAGVEVAPPVGKSVAAGDDTQAAVGLGGAPEVVHELHAIARDLGEGWDVALAAVVLRIALPGRSWLMPPLRKNTRSVPSS